MKKDKMKDICEAFIKTTAELYDIPGICIGASIEDTRYITAAGYADINEKRTMREGDVFRCGSLAKLFTSEGIMRLEKRGRLSLEDRISDILPDLRERFTEDKRWKDVRIVHMLAHTSGLGETEMAWRPEERRFRYSDKAYDILGRVISETEGRSFEDFMRTEFFDPLDMEDSSFAVYLTGKETAAPYEKDRERRMVPAETENFAKGAMPSSGLASNAEDLLKWAEALMKSPAGHWRKSPYVHIPGGGDVTEAGWFLRKEGGIQAAGHEGGVRGYRACLWIMEEAKAAAVVLVNISSFPAGKTGLRLLEKLMAAAAD